MIFLLVANPPPESACLFFKCHSFCARCTFGTCNRFKKKKSTDKKMQFLPPTPPLTANFKQDKLKGCKRDIIFECQLNTSRTSFRTISVFNSMMEPFKKISRFKTLNLKDMPSIIDKNDCIMTGFKWRLDFYFFSLPSFQSHHCQNLGGANCSLSKSTKS